MAEGQGTGVVHDRIEPVLSAVTGAHDPWGEVQVKWKLQKRGDLLHVASRKLRSPSPARQDVRGRCSTLTVGHLAQARSNPALFLAVGRVWS